MPSQPLPFKALPPAITTPNAASVGANIYNFLDCDTYGLDTLADLMRTFVATIGNPTVAAVTKQVDTVVELDDDPTGGWRPPQGQSGPGSVASGWLGQAAQAFYNSFIVDAAIMNGLHHVLCEAANLLQNFAASMASLEGQLEDELQQTGQQAVPPFDISWLGVNDMGGGLYFANLPANDSTLPYGIPVFSKLDQVYLKYKAEADAQRHRVAASLISLSLVLSQAVAYYKGTSASVKGIQPEQALLQNWDTTPPGTVPGDHDDFSGPFESSLQQEVSATNLSGDGAMAQVTQVLQTLGADSTNVANVISAFNDLKTAKGATAGTVAGLNAIGDVILAAIGFGA